jgi:hypothetical protein
MKRYSIFLERLNHSDRPPKAQSPFVVSAAVSLAAFVVIYWLDSPQVSSLRVWWGQWLVYAVIPTLLAFIILYRSSWHQEMRRAARTLLLALLSCLIFPGALLAAGVAVLLGVLVYSCYFDHFLRFHY